MATEPGRRGPTPPKPLAAGLDPMANPNPFPSTYAPAPSQTTALKGATILPAAGARIDGGIVVMAGGRILAVGGSDIPIPAGATVTLQPGGLHVMLIGLTAPLAQGGRVPLTLRFARAGEVRVVLDVQAAGARGMGGHGR